MTGVCVYVLCMYDDITILKDTDTSGNTDQCWGVLRLRAVDVWCGGLAVLEGGSGVAIGAWGNDACS